MSNVYHTEPPTQGKVLLHTTFGDIEIELWAKEAPRACRNFVQLSMEGYYDNTIFHRIIKDFMVQGGDPTGTGAGGESIYGEPFRDEIHTRIRFNHRGQVAMANANKSHTNTSQFFITLDKCEWLNKKHTIFGKVAGATIFNALRMGELETDSNERPLEPPRITSVEVVENPFDDIFPRDISKTNPEEIKKQQEKAKQEKKQKEFDKKYKKRKLTLLSFGDEEAEDVPQDNTGIKSSHDILNDKKLSRTTEQDVVNQTKENHERRKNTNSSLREDDPKYSENPEDFDAKMRKKIEAKQAATASSQTQEQEREAKIGERYEEFRKMLKREGDEKRKATKVKGKAADEEQAQKLLTPAQQLRKKYLDRKRQHGSREKETLERLNKFKGSLQAIAKDPSIAPKVDSDKVEGYHGQVLEDEGGEDENSLEWMAAQLKSKKHIDDAYRAGEILDDGMMTYDPVRDTDKPPPGPVEFGATEGREDDNRTRKRHRTDRR